MRSVLELHLPNEERIENCMSWSCTHTHISQSIVRYVIIEVLWNLCEFRFHHVAFANVDNIYEIVIGLFAWY